MRDRHIPGLAALALCAVLADPSCRALAQPLSGDFDIGPGGDFSTIAAAVAALAAEGVVGPVTLHLASGVYVEQLVIPPIPGAGAASPITFRSATGVRQDVLWQFGLDSQETVVLIDGADHLRFRHLSFDATPMPQLSMRILELQNGADDIEVFDCELRGNSGASTSALVSSTVSTGWSHVRIENCLFESFHRAIQLTGGGSTRGATIRANQIRDDSSSPAVHVANCDSVRIEKNHITARNQAVFTQGSTNQHIQDNQVLAEISGIVVSGGGGTTGKPIGMVSNNMIRVGSAQTGGGLILGGNVSGLRVDHNTVLANEATLSGGAALLIDQVSSGQGQIRISNNLFLHAGAGVACRARGSVPNLDFDYNDLYSAGATLANWYNVLYSDLPALQAAGGFNAHSVSKSVQFENPEDLHLSSCSVGDPELRGIALPEVPIDIDGDTRSTNLPYMGADEAAPSPRYLFAARRTYGVVAPWHIASGDLDGDGDVDLAVTTGPSTGPGAVTIGWNDGMGNFAFTTQVAVSSGWAWKVQVSDLDADAAADLVVLSGDVATTVWLIWSEGGGAFAAPEVLADAGCCPFNDVQIGDLDGDGDPDISLSYTASVANDNEPGIFGYVNQGDRLLQIDSGDFTSFTVEDPVWHQLHDLDGDGLLDAVLMDDHVNDSELAIHFNLGSDAQGVWRSFDPIGRRFDIGAIVPMRAGDIDGDDAVDLITLRFDSVFQDSTVLKLWPNDGIGNFTTSTPINTDPYRVPRQFLAFDYEGDADLDLVTMNMTGDLSLYVNDGSGAFSRLVGCDPAGPIGGSFVWYRDILRDDFDSDGILDVAVLHSNDGTDSLSVFMNAGWRPVGVESGPGNGPIAAPAGPWLGQNTPNPFNPTTSIAYRVVAADGRQPSRVTLALYNVRGEQVRTLFDGALSAGSYEARWDGRDDNGRAVSSGVYLYVLAQEGAAREAKKMVLVR